MRLPSPRRRAPLEHSPSGEPGLPDDRGAYSSSLPIRQPPGSSCVAQRAGAAAAAAGRTSLFAERVAIPPGWLCCRAPSLLFDE